MNQSEFWKRRKEFMEERHEFWQRIERPAVMMAIEIMGILVRKYLSGIITKEEYDDIVEKNNEER